MVAWAIQNMINVYHEEHQILSDEKLTEAEKAIKVRGPQGTSTRLVNYMLLLQPALEEAEKEFSDHKDTFFTWFRDRWDFIQSKNLLEGKCSCKGCKTEEPVVS